MSWAIEMKDYSQRRACALVGIAPHVLRCQSSRLDDAGLRQRVRELSSGRLSSPAAPAAEARRRRYVL